MELNVAGILSKLLLGLCSCHIAIVINAVLRFN